MLPHERKTGPLMGECHIAPCLWDMTGLAAVAHHRLELTAMGIVMTSIARDGPFQREDSRPLSIDTPHRVALCARYGSMSTFQRKTDLLVIIERECGWEEALFAVA